ncbi:MAG TPA: hypothetical protein VGN12_07435 [Pirellulales bacterium]|jgi:hypothetical protein
MSTRFHLLIAGLLATVLCAPAAAASLTSGMKKGTPDLKSAGPATFAPEGVLLVGDTLGAMIYAIATGDTSSGTAGQPVIVDKVDEKIAALLGIATAEILINDLAVNPETGSSFLTVSRGRGPDAKPAIIRIDSAGKITEFPLTDVTYSSAAIPNAPQDKGRQDVTTDLQFTGGQVLVAGLSNEEFASQLRMIPFPFGTVDKGASVEIYHGSHGRFETKAPVRTFAVFDVAGQPNVLAAYTCTPLVKFPVAELKPGSKVKGTTVAELGNHNRPLDMVVYNKDGRDWILMSNSARGLIKVDLANIDKSEGITERIPDVAGLPYSTIEEFKKVDQLDRLDKGHAVLLVRNDGGSLALRAIELP